MKTKHLRHILFTFFIACSMLSGNAFAGMATFADRGDVQHFIANMSNDHGFSRAYLDYLFNQVRIRHSILLVLNSPHEANPWYRYRSFFITGQRVQDGVAFWNAHEKALANAEKKYGVPANIIVAIIGVETHYGSFLGHYRVIDSLSTLAFEYPPRQTYFRHELEQYLLLSREQEFNPLVIKGSYEGAIGMPQFMPSSYRRLGVSYAGNERPDLLGNPDDAIISVANYFKTYGWQTGQPVAIPAIITGDNYHSLITHNHYKPAFTVAQFEAQGVKPDKPLAKNDKAILFRLQVDPENYHYWLGLNNFYVITGYNPNLHYAMAVYELGQKMKKCEIKKKPRITRRAEHRRHGAIRNPAAICHPLASTWRA